MSDTVLEQVVEVDVDLDKPVLCDSCRLDDLEVEATWYGQMPCCRAESLVCDFHKQKYEKQDRLTFRKAAPGLPRCTASGGDAARAIWRKL